MKNAESKRDIQHMVAAMGKDDAFSLRGIVCAQALEWCLEEIERLEKVIDRAGSMAMRSDPPGMEDVRSGLDSRIYKLLHRLKDQQGVIDMQERLIAEFNRVIKSPFGDKHAAVDTDFNQHGGGQ